MGGIGGAWAGVKRHLAARPWTVNVYVASVLVAPLLLLTPEVSLERGRVEALLHLLLVAGVWAGSRFAWGLTLALLSVSFLMGIVATAVGFGLILLGILAVWIGLLVAAPTQRWVTGGRSPRPPPGPAAKPRPPRAPSDGWRSRPLTLRIYVGASLATMLLSLVFDREVRAFPAIPVTLGSLALLMLLWNGSAGMWWLSVIANGAAAALSTISEHPRAWVTFALSAASLLLLVHSSTRAWFNERIAERFP